MAMTEAQETLLRGVPENFPAQSIRRHRQRAGEEEAEAAGLAIRRLAAPLAGLPEVERAALLYRMLMLNLRYDYEALERRDGKDPAFAYLGALRRGKAVCNGVSQLYSLLLYASGIPSQIVIGCVGEEELHAWNLVELGGRWYQCDCTWDLGCRRPRYLFRDDRAFRADHMWLPERYPAAKSSLTVPETIWKKEVKELLCTNWKRALA